jgi:hypothetical protein
MCETGEVAGQLYLMKMVDVVMSCWFSWSWNIIDSRILACHDWGVSGVSGAPGLVWVQMCEDESAKY